MAKSLGGRNSKLYRERQQLKRFICIARAMLPYTPAEDVPATRQKIIDMTAQLKRMDRLLKFWQEETLNMTNSATDDE